MIEDPGSTGGPLGLRERGVEVGVYVGANHARFPFDSVEMKSVCKILAGRKAEGSRGVAGATRCAGAVKGAVDGGGLFTDVFHDVDFTGCRPASGDDVVAKHPESGPHALPCGNFDARFKA